MAVLSDRDITEAVKAGMLGIEPFDPDGLTPNGYDLTIGEVLTSRGGETVGEGTARVGPQTWFAVSTLEYVRLPVDVSASLWIRTSWARKGVLASFGRIDAGFEGNLTLSAFNGSGEPVELPIGKTFAQMVFETLRTPPLKSYDERSGHYQGQRGVTLERGG